MWFKLPVAISSSAAGVNSTEPQILTVHDVRHACLRLCVCVLVHHRCLQEWTCCACMPRHASTRPKMLKPLRACCTSKSFFSSEWLSDILVGHDHIWRRIWGPHLALTGDAASSAAFCLSEVSVPSLAWWAVYSMLHATEYPEHAPSGRSAVSSSPASPQTIISHCGSFPNYIYRKHLIDEMLRGHDFLCRLLGLPFTYLLQCQHQSQQCQWHPLEPSNSITLRIRWVTEPPPTVPL